MAHVTPVVLVSEKNKMKKVISGPRAETLMFIRHFARAYQFDPYRQKQRASKFLMN
jgi:hypothetical protein